MANTAAQPGLLRDINYVSRRACQQLEPRAAPANSSAARECSNDRDAVVDRDGSGATTSFAARIAVVTIDDTTAKNDADYRSDSNAIAATATDSAVIDAAAGLGDWLRTGARNRCLLNWSRLRCYGSRLDRLFGLDFDRSLDASWSRLVLRDTL